MAPGEPLYQRGSNQGDGEGRRMFLAIALSVGLVWVYMTFLAPKPPPPGEAGEGADPTTPAQTTDAAGAATTPTAGAGAADDAISDADWDDDDSAEGGAPAAPVHASAGGTIYEPVGQPADTIDLQGEGFSATFSSQGGGPSSWVLHDYKKEFDLPWIPSWLWNGIKSGFDFERFTLACPEGEPVDLVGSAHAYHLVPRFQDGGLTRLHTADRNVGDGLERAYVWSSAPVALDWRRWELVSADGRQLVYRTERPTLGGALEIVTTYDLPEDGYLMGYQVTVRNTGEQLERLSPSFSVIQPIEPAKNRYSSSGTPFLDRDGKPKDWPINKVDKKQLISDSEAVVRYAGVEDRYFMTALVPHEPAVRWETAPVGWLDEDQMVLVERPPMVVEGDDPQPRTYRSTLAYDERDLAPGESATYTFDVYMGPKVTTDLKPHGLGLEDTVQYGVFSIIARPMLLLLTLFHNWVGSWGIAIILLTVVIKLLVFPLDQASYKSMKKMRVLAPRMQEIRDKFKSDPTRQQQEIMAMYKEAGANPFSGCFPMLIQMPIWFALYRVLWGSIELYQVPFLYFCDLTSRDPIGIFPLALAGVFMLQQKMSPPPTDPNQKMMMQFMPLFFAVIMFAMPSGLVVYILVSTLLRLAQQWMVNRSDDDDGSNKAVAKA